VKSNSRLVKLKTSDIYYIEALKDYVVINTLNTRYTMHSTMKDIEAKLPESEFIRVHRSFIVRIDKIVAIEQPNLILENDKKTIPIGGSYKDDLAKRLNLVSWCCPRCSPWAGCCCWSMSTAPLATIPWQVPPSMRTSHCGARSAISTHLLGTSPCVTCGPWLLKSSSTCCGP
jgi:hypothetical protein